MTTFVAGVFGPSAAVAQTAPYPSKPIRLIVPFAPGGVADLLSRVIAQRLGPLYNQQIVVDNRPGSGGHIGADLAVKAPPDGYTIVFATIAQNAAYAMYSKLPYDPVKDLVPIILLAEGRSSCSLKGRACSRCIRRCRQRT
jgi:tripartite-type tricarboxylate transporter receptor subunit TctC